MDHASLIIDSRNVTRGMVKTRARVVSLASARPGVGTPNQVSAS